MTKTRMLVLGVALTVAGACGKAARFAPTASHEAAAPEFARAKASGGGAAPGSPAAYDGRSGGWLLPRANAQTTQPGQKHDAVVLIKKGALTLIVRDARDAEAKLNDVLKGYDAYLSARQSNAIVPQSKYLGPSEVRSITLTIKVEAKRFDEFLGRVKQIGSYTSESVTTEDVTFAFMDLNARLGNQRKVEERLVGYLADKTKDFKFILEVEKELSRVREQIEQLSTQLRTMENQIAYSTLTLEISVQADYVPPEKRGFWQEVGETFRGSIAAMGATLRTFAIVVVAVLPWLVLGLLFVYVIIRLIGWLGNRKRKPTAPTPKPE